MTQYLAEGKQNERRRDLGALPVFQLGHDKIEGPAGYAYMLTSTKFNREISLNKKN